MTIISEGGGKYDRGWPFELGSALWVGVGPFLLLGRGWPLGRGLLGVGVGPSVGVE